MPILPLHSQFPYLMFPLAPAPTITSVTSVGTSGGSATCDGTGFQQTPIAIVNIAGTPVTLSVTWVSSTELVELLLVGGSYTAGSWNLTITNPDGQSVTALNAFEITSEETPQTIFGSALVAQWKASNATTIAGNVTSIADSSGNSNNLSVVSTIPPTIVASDTRFSENPQTVVMNSANSTYLQCPAFALGSTGTMFVGAAVDYTGPGTSTETFVFYNVSSDFAVQAKNTNWGFYYNNYVPDITTPATTAGPGTFLATAQTGVGASLSINNGPVETYATSSSVASGNTFMVGANNSVSPNEFCSFVWPEIIVVNSAPTSTQLTALCQYFNDKYGVTQAPTFSSASPVPASVAGAAIRISGTNFGAGITAQVIVGGTPISLTITMNTATVIDATAPSIAAGTYDLILGNPDGKNNTFTGVIVVQSATANAAVAAMHIFGINAIGVYTGANVTLNGSAVSAWLDQSGMSNHLLQATSAYQPAYSSGASDATFNDKPYLTANGTSQFLECASFQLDATTAYLSYCAVIKPGASGSIRTITNFFSGAEPSLQLSGSNVPEIYAAGYTTYGSSISGAQNVDGYTSSTLTYINVADGGSPVTTSQNAYVSAAGPMFAFTNSGSAQFGNMPAAAIVVLNAAPSLAQLGSWHTFCQSYYGTI